jgi:hypothetical protein
MTLQGVVELILALSALLLLARDTYRGWLDKLRRPITLLVGALVGALLLGSFGGRPYPSSWWLVLPGSLLAWEVARGWRQAPRCHLREAGIGAFAASFLMAAVGFGLGGGTLATTLFVAAAGSAGSGAGLLWWSHRREPYPWRLGDVSHYERRFAERRRY